jgi:diacylglycerol kinase family enzyme/membrane-associated phospholipid phosphatase
MAATRVDRAMRAVSRSANKGRLWLVLAAVGVLVGGRTRRAAIRGTGALAATSFVTNAIFKPLIRRKRPAAELTPIFRRVHRAPRTTSFPSGHAASASAFLAGVTLENPAAGAAITPLAAAVGYSRVHVGVHHVSDVVAGAALGAAIALATRRWWPVRQTEPSRVRENVPAPALPGGAGLVVVVNRRSDPAAYDQVWISDRLPEAEIVELDGEVDVDTALAGRAGAARALGAVGGDGTVAAVAAAALRHRLPLALFPAGTFNHFARDVGIESFEDTVRAVVAGDAVAVDVAEVNGVPYLNTAVIGAYPDLVRRRGELESRIGKWLAMAVAAGQVLHRHRPLRLRLDGEPARIWTLFVGNGRYHSRGPSPAWRPRLDDGLLDVQFLRADARFSRTRTVLATLAGLAERSGVYRSRLVTELGVISRDGPVAIARDGEWGEPASRFRFAKLPGTLVVYRSSGTH